MAPEFSIFFFFNYEILLLSGDIELRKSSCQPNITYIVILAATLAKLLAFLMPEYQIF